MSCALERKPQGGRAGSLYQAVMQNIVHESIPSGRANVAGCMFQLKNRAGMQPHLAVGQVTQRAQFGGRPLLLGKSWVPILTLFLLLF